VHGARGTVTNLANIVALGTAGTGVEFTAGGALQNGQSNNGTAQIVGGDGVVITGGNGGVGNYGTIFRRPRFPAAATLRYNAAGHGREAERWTGKHCAARCRPSPG
jgi:hypothetical protein